MKYIFLLLASFCLFLCYSCSSSTDTRYSKDQKEPGEKEDVVIEDQKSDKNSEEDFDFTPYRTKLEIPETELALPTGSTNSEVWYEYEEKEVDTTASLKKIIDKVNGYRVLILTTDNLEEANNMKDTVYSKITQKEVYVIFDPPFYKVMVGDFVDYAEAKNFGFKMSQLGYAESRVVNETVNIFEQ